ncbi:MAG: glycosyltransferase family 2 protein [Desulfamplus sp.]|nr:glycosyltransferase family 2 protein [Desulfamplus sp.]
MSVSAIIVNYHTSKYLPELIDDLIALKDIEQIFIVDNSSEIDGSFLSNYFVSYPHRIELIKPGKNLGFGAGVNLAASRASSEYLLVINPDVRLFPDCLTHLLEAARKYGSVLTGPRFFWDDAKKYKLPPSQGASSWLDYAFEAAGGSRLEFEHLSFYWQMCHERFWSYTTPFTELFLSGACVLINRQWAMESLSAVFDERFFLYFEDNDISLRAHFNGVPPLCVPAAEALHHYDQSPSPEKSKADLMAQSHIQFSEKYYGGMTYLLNKKDTYLPEISDMGLNTSPFSFDTKCLEPSVGNLYFEIGVNPCFVPFAQTDIKVTQTDIKGLYENKIDVFTLDSTIWNRLAKGIYYGRARDSIKGTLKIWKWQKV